MNLRLTSIISGFLRLAVFLGISSLPIVQGQEFECLEDLSLLKAVIEAYYFSLYFTGDVETLNTIAEIYGPIEQWCFGSLTDMSGAFRDACFVTFEDFSAWDVSLITNMESMFDGCTFMTAGNFATWNVSGVTNMARMFNRARFFNEPINDWNVENVVTTLGMFSGCFSFNQPLTNWKTSSLVNAAIMFANNLQLTQDLGHFDMSQVNTMRLMFFVTTRFIEENPGSPLFNGDISQWDTSRVTNMESMFGGNIAFNQDISGWNTSSLQLSDNMFNGAVSFNQDISTWDVSSLKRSAFMFVGAESFNQSLCDWREKFPRSNGYNLWQGFIQSGCPFQEDPGFWKRSPYCYECEVNLLPPMDPTPAPTIGPTTQESGAFANDVGTIYEVLLFISTSVLVFFAM